MTLPTDPKARKAIPLQTGCYDYFPRALAAVADCSRAGNEQHHPGTPLHWDRSKSTDEADSLARHQQQRGTIDGDGVRHSAKVAWRALAQLEKELEAVEAAEATALKLKPELPQLIDEEFHHSDAVVRSYGPRPGCNCTSCKCERERVELTA